MNLHFSNVVASTVAAMADIASSRNIFSRECHASQVTLNLQMQRGTEFWNKNC